MHRGITKFATNVSNFQFFRHPFISRAPESLGINLPSAFMLIVALTDSSHALSYSIFLLLPYYEIRVYPKMSKLVS